MKIEGRRKSTNVEDRRGLSTGAKAGIGGIGGIIVIALITFLKGGNIGDVVTNVMESGVASTEQTVTTNTEFSPEEQKLKDECEIILGMTEDVWKEVFPREHYGEYKAPTLVFFSNSVNSACGSATSAVGPFYCSGDQKLYIDLSFFLEMKKQLGVEGNTFAYAYVIAHEIGHHVEFSRGILTKDYSAMRETKNQTSVRMELLADYYAGVWAHYEDAKNHSLEYGDLEKGFELARAIGDDWLQKRAQGYASPESFTHGTSEQRKRWLKRGYETGDMSVTTFDIANYNDL